jgi:hypothetical protein
MAAPHYECVDVSSNNPYDGMTYYTHHKNKDHPHYVWTYVPCHHSARGKEKIQILVLMVTERKIV